MGGQLSGQQERSRPELTIRDDNPARRGGPCHPPGAIAQPGFYVQVRPATRPWGDAGAEVHGSGYRAHGGGCADTGGGHRPARYGERAEHGEDLEAPRVAIMDSGADNGRIGPQATANRQPLARGQ